MPSLNSSAYPAMLVIGVRSSWLTLETSSCLTWSTSSSRSTEACSRSRAAQQRVLHPDALGHVLAEPM